VTDVMAKRRKARELALQILFQADVGNLPIEEAIETTLADASDLDKEICDYAVQLARGIGSGNLTLILKSKASRLTGLLKGWLLWTGI